MTAVWVVDAIVHLVTSFLKVEEDLQGSSQIKEETDGTELKQEPMEIEEKKPEIKVEPKEEEESSTNGTTSQSTSPSQPRKKSTCMKTEFLWALFSWAFVFHNLSSCWEVCFACVCHTCCSGRSVLCH